MPPVVYIVRCSDGTLYTGATTDIHRRLKQHNDGTGARYTRSRRPVSLVWKRSMKTLATALRKEYAIKQLSRAQKERLIAAP